MIGAGRKLPGVTSPFVILLVALLGNKKVTSQPYEYCDVSTYYDGLVSNTRDEMHLHIKSTHRNAVPYTSSSKSDVWDALIDIDSDSSGQNIHLIYGNKYIPSTPHDDGSCTSWNREHLWPRSRGVSESGKDNTDLHHLRPVDCNVNSARANRYFSACGVVSKQDCVVPAHVEAASDTERDSFIFLPPADKRGDIARSIFYMDLRYDGDEANTLDLVVSDCPETVPDDAGMGYLSQLIQWHYDDPVDAKELERNEKVCTNWQGNRNPFVDFPDLVSMYFGSSRGAPQEGAGYDCSVGNDIPVNEIPHVVDNTPKPSSPSTNIPTVATTGKSTHSPTMEIMGGLIITGVIDGPLSGGLPKAIELFVVYDIPDLSLYGVGFANNGNGSPGVEFTFPAGSSAAARSYITIAYEDLQYSNFFGVSPNFVTGYASINGNDAIELFFSGKVIDVYGDVNVDGTGTIWDYADGWAYRNHTSTSSAIFNNEDWTFSGTDALDSCATNIDCANYFPSKSYNTSMPVSSTSATNSASLCIIFYSRYVFSVLIVLVSFYHFHAHGSYR